jgi:hypothetical protein
MTLSERCRAQAESMDLEGWYVCANILREAADRLETLEEGSGEAVESHSTTNPKLNAR